MMVRTPLGPLASCDRTITGFPSSLTWVNLTHPRLSFVNLASRGWPQPPSPLWWPGRSLQPQQGQGAKLDEFSYLSTNPLDGPFFFGQPPKLQRAGCLNSGGFQVINHDAILFWGVRFSPFSALSFGSCVNFQILHFVVNFCSQSVASFRRWNCRHKV